MAAPCCITLEDGHPGTKRLDKFLILVASMYDHMSYGLWLDRVCCEDPDPMGQVVVEGLL